MKLKARSASRPYIDVPRTWPSWEIDAEEYFRETLRPLRGKDIEVSLQVTDEETSGWDETNVMWGSLKVGQLFFVDHQRLAPYLRALRAKGQRIQGWANVAKDLEISMLLPDPDKIIQLLLESGALKSPMELQMSGEKHIRVKESGKYQGELLELDGGIDGRDWQGVALCIKYSHVGGKYDGKEGVNVLVGGKKIGTIGPRYTEDLFHILHHLDSGNDQFSCTISASRFEEGKLFATLKI